jgi:hypothetical protein
MTQVATGLVELRGRGFMLVADRSVRCHDSVVDFVRGMTRADSI